MARTTIAVALDEASRDAADDSTPGERRRDSTRASAHAGRSRRAARRSCATLARSGRVGPAANADSTCRVACTAGTVDGRRDPRWSTELSGVATFTERLRITAPDGTVLEPDPTDPVVAGALDVLALAASISYLKATLPRHIELAGRPVGPAGIAMLRALLTDGLAELALRTGLGPLDDAFTITGAGRVGRTAPAVQRPPGSLVTVGGGKDSALTLALAARHEPDPLAVAVNPRAPMERTAAWAGVGLVRIDRRLDRRLLELNAAGAINGHVPITAIVTAASVVAAAMLGRGTVLVSNERSADAATREVDGWRVNHQYSKTSAFEHLLGAALDAAGATTRVVSLLRPLSELAIARGVARERGLVAQVTSCNAAFAMDGPGDGWCGRCDKCRFVQLALAPFMGTRAASGRRPRLRRARRPGRRSTPSRRCSTLTTKPFECVGTVDEVRLALRPARCAQDGWRDAAAVRALADADAADRDGRLAGALRPDPDVELPEPFDTWLAALTTGGAAMIVVLGHGRETRAWLARRDAADTPEVLVLDETAAAIADVAGAEAAVVDLDDADASVQRSARARWSTSCALPA
jgi:UDP-N-acetyl-alpha-D-muramoyl-L-alanyl-L-glutamate epimerase